MSEEIQGFRFRASTRVASGEKVRLRFDREGPRLLAVCSDLSLEGMFVATQDLRPLGSVVEFEIEGSEDEIARGLADVVWARKEKVGPGRHAGMGLQFRYVDPGSREVIAEMVERRHRQAEDESAAKPPEPAKQAPPAPGSEVRGPVVSDKTLAGIAAGAAIAAAARAGPRPPAEFGLADEVVLAGRGGGLQQPAPPAPPAVVLDGESRAARARGFPWLVVLFVALVLVAGAMAWWIWFGERSPTSTDRSGRPAAAGAVEPGRAPAVTRPESATSAAESAGSAAAVEVLRVAVVESDESSALIAVELSAALGDGGARVSRLEAPARLLVRVPGADRVPGEDPRLDTPLVTAVRSAVHLEQGGTELHLVFDLASDRVRAESRIDGRRLLLRLSND